MSVLSHCTTVDSPCTFPVDLQNFMEFSCQQLFTQCEIYMMHVLPYFLLWISCLACWIIFLRICQLDNIGSLYWWGDVDHSAITTSCIHAVMTKTWLRLCGRCLQHAAWIAQGSFSPPGLYTHVIWSDGANNQSKLIDSLYYKTVFGQRCVNSLDALMFSIGGLLVWNDWGCFEDLKFIDVDKSYPCMQHLPSMMRTGLDVPHNHYKMHLFNL